MASLNVWMNGDFVGEWLTLRTGTPVFRYSSAWTESPRGRALSLSLPITADLEVRGIEVDHYFDNLLPENPDIRRRLRERFRTRSTQAFDLLEAIGRDCVGAVQLLPRDQEPLGWDRIDTTPLSEAQVERHLHAVTAPPRHGRSGPDPENEDFRISIAGAQEKTALLSMGGAWYRPHGATPTTHILKLPLGIVGNFRGDFSDSVENEWLCAQLLREFGLPMAETAMLKFGEQKVLAVKRFDRRWIGADEAHIQAPGFVPATGQWIARLPQEDFCQATGRPPTQKYEADGGPSIEEILGLLATSESAAADQSHFILAQLAFWLLAATDGHGKNFSVHQRPGGRFRLTPFYDVLSAWPVIGNGANALPIQDARLAMAVRGKSKHYRLREIQPRHWHGLARHVRLPNLWDDMLELVQTATAKIEKVRQTLPADFPERVIVKIAEGVRQQVDSFLASVPSS
jgi:serine/threonine-protein kinase HipA